MDADNLGRIAIAYVDTARRSPTRSRLVLITRDVLGNWSPPRAVSPPREEGKYVVRPSVAFSGDGGVALAWRRQEHWRLGEAQATVAPFAGEVPEARTLSAPGREGASPRLAADGKGSAIVVWVEAEREWSAGPLKASIRPPGGAFGPSVALPGSAMDWEGAEVASAADGSTLLMSQQQTATSPGGGHIEGLRWRAARSRPACSRLASSRPVLAAHRSR
jgi:hypothetical protein